ncbi:MAG: tetratricopeptide repeat protein [Burkholderiaceae bacterium]
MALDILGMWNFSDVPGTEQKFREALKTAKGDDALILQTQIARTYGLRKDFAKAQAVLKEVEPQLPGAGVEPNVRYWLELGRSMASPKHSKEAMTEEVRKRAGAAYMRAFELADKAGLGYLAVDAMHMMGYVDTEPAKLLDWNLKSLAYMDASKDPEAKKWEGSLVSNVGYALHENGRYEEALGLFKRALAVKEKQGKAEGIRIAHWYIGWTLRSLKRYDEALAIQLRLEKEFDEAKQPDPYVYEELAALYKAKEDPAKATHYQAKFDAAKGK